MSTRVTSPETSQMLAEAFDLHRAGELNQAVQLYRMCLPHLPLTPQTLSLRAAVHNNLGAALRGTGDRSGATEAFSQAVMLLPDYAEAHINLGVAQMEQSDYALALESFNKALILRPACAEAFNNKAVALRKLHRLKEAEDALIQALVLRHGYAEAQMNLAAVYRDGNRLEEAQELLNAILQEHPAHAPAHVALGTVLQQKGLNEEAAQAFRKAHDLDPANVRSLLYLASLFKDQKRYAEAINTAQAALNLDPDSVEAHSCLGAIYHNQGNFQLAEEEYKNSLSRFPKNASVLADLGSVLLLQGKPTGLELLKEAIELEPENAAAHWSLAAALLRFGRYREAWPEFEWRWKWSRFQSHARNFNCPQWKGEELNGATILLHAEQGLGDTLQFVRYAPLVAAKGGRVILEVQPGLQSLLSNIPGVQKVLSFGDPLPEFQLHCPLMSLPLAFQTELETIPAEIPYIATPNNSPATRSKDLRVGLVWAGSTNHHGDNLRSLSRKELLRLKELQGIQFLSLQQGAPAEELATADFPQQEWEPFVDFAATANAIATLDLVITVDTSVAHLAGAMGKPVWILLAHAADWRWMNSREDSPWYPSARLFRQKKLGDWSSVVTRIEEELQKLTTVIN